MISENPWNTIFFYSIIIGKLSCKNPAHIWTATPGLLIIFLFPFQTPNREEADGQRAVERVAIPAVFQGGE